MTRRLERDLLAAGYRLVRVPTRLMAAARVVCAAISLPSIKPTSLAKIRPR